MENSESITESSLESPNGLHKDDETLHQAQKRKVSETEVAPLKDKTRTAKNEDRKEVGAFKSRSCSNFID